MNPSRSASKRKAPFLVVELVGPAGSGKSTIIEALRKTHGDALGYIGHPQPTMVHRLFSALEALPTAIGLQRLTLSERRRLFDAHRGIRATMRWISTLPTGVHVIDEGPHRIIHDQACYSEAQLAAWRRIVIRQLAQLTNTPTRIIHVRTDPVLRRKRRLQRMGPLERRDPNFNAEIPNRHRSLMFIRNELPKISPRASAFHAMEEIENITSIDVAVDKIFSRLTQDI